MADSFPDISPAAPTARVLVNGEACDVVVGLGLTALLSALGLRPGTVVVEYNGTALTRAETEAVTLRAGDTLEIVRAVAGG